MGRRRAFDWSIEVGERERRTRPLYNESLLEDERGRGHLEGRGGALTWQSDSSLVLHSQVYLLMVF